MRTLTWYLATVGPGVSQRETYRLDGEYNPVRAWVHADVAPIRRELLVDINVDGVSIFAYLLRLQDDKDAETTDFANVQFSKDSLVSLDIDDAGGNTQGLTIGLEVVEA